MRAALAAAVLLLAAGPAGAGMGWVPTPSSGGGGLFNVPVKSIVEMRFENVVQQNYDLSCGAAALATLLTYFYQDEHAEQQIIETVFEYGDAEKISREGFSMLELKHYAERAGYVSQGYRIDDVQNLERIKIPYLALTNTQGYNHFVVVKGVSDGKVHMADPAFGNRSQSIESFKAGWNNVILGVMHADNSGNSNFAGDATPDPRVYEWRVLTDFGVTPLQPRAGMFN